MAIGRFLTNLTQPRSKGNGKNGARQLIELVDVVKVYETPAGPFTALKKINLQVDAGEFVGIVGRSGSGKSTLINMLTGIDRPTSGEIYVNQAPLHTFNERQMAIWRGANIGIVFQFFQLLPTLTCVENVMLPMDFCNVYAPHERYDRALQYLELVELLDQAHKLPTDVSGGQQQRVAIARALANDPPIIVADEPTGNLDSQTAATVFGLFERLVDEGKTVLMVSHDPDLSNRATRTLHLEDGEITDEERGRHKRPDTHAPSPQPDIAAPQSPLLSGAGAD